MNRRWLASALVALLILVGTLAAAQDKQLPADANGDLDAVTLRDELRHATNQARAAHGLPPLDTDAGLTRAAQAHAEENAERGVLDHGSPDPTDDEPIERIGLAGVALVEIGENLAFEPRSNITERVVQGWLASPRHRENLLASNYTHVGFGVARGDAGVYVTQLLGVRLLDRIDASARVEERAQRTWHLELEGPPGSEALLFIGGQPVAPVSFETNRVEVDIDAPDAPSELVLAVPVGGNRYSISDRISIDPDGRWASDGMPPYDAASIAVARMTSEIERGVTIEIAYADEDAALQLLVDGVHRPEVRPEEGVLRTWLPSADVPRELSVGVLLVDGRIRVSERFTLREAPDVTLVPGTAAPPEGTP